MITINLTTNELQVIKDALMFNIECCYSETTAGIENDEDALDLLIRNNNTLHKIERKVQQSMDA